MKPKGGHKGNPACGSQGKGPVWPPAWGQNTWFGWPEQNQWNLNVNAEQGLGYGQGMPEQPNTDGLSWPGWKPPQ
eukprot:1914646-Heterocapsa_arctica.AAC.1